MNECLGITRREEKLIDGIQSMDYYISISDKLIYDSDVSAYVGYSIRPMLLLEPLSKFPVVADLIVDRSVIYEQLNQAKAYLEHRAASDQRQHKQQYSVAKCLKCGLCLEVCPNYYPGGTFYGAVLANESYLIASQSPKGDSSVIGEYKTHFGAGCSKALSCQSVCPMEIETITSILRMNRK